MLNTYEYLRCSKRWLSEYQSVVTCYSMTFLPQATIAIGLSSIQSILHGPLLAWFFFRVYSVLFYSYSLVNVSELR